MNAAANALEVGLKPTPALPCRQFQLMAHSVRGGGGGLGFRVRAVLFRVLHVQPKAAWISTPYMTPWRATLPKRIVE